jgi:hypothetical protein
MEVTPGAKWHELSLQINEVCIFEDNVWMRKLCHVCKSHILAVNFAGCLTLLKLLNLMIKSFPLVLTFTVIYISKL